MTFNNSILAGTTLVRDDIRSEGYVAGSAGWIIKRNGDAEFNDLVARGDIQASSVQVVDPDDPTNKTTIIPSSSTGFPDLKMDWHGTLRYHMQVANDGSPNLAIRGGSLSSSHQLNLSCTTAAATLDLGSLIDFIRFRVVHGGAHSISTNGSDNPLDLQTDGGVLHYDGVPIMREVGAIKNEANTATFTTTETVTDTVTAALVNGRTYEIEWTARYSNAASGINTTWRLRENDILGTVIDTDNHNNPNTIGQKVQLRSRYTAVATGNKSFVVTGVGGGGTGNVTRLGAVGNPSLLTVKEVA